MKILIANDGSECADDAIEDLKRAGFPGKNGSSCDERRRCKGNAHFPIFSGKGVIEDRTSTGN